MIHLTDGVILYHGSYIGVSDIDMSRCHAGLDLGIGFYLTSSLEQTLAFVPASIRKAKQRKLIPQEFRIEDGVVSIQAIECLSFVKSMRYGEF